MRRRFLILVVLLGIARPLLACSCGTNPPFLAVADKAPLIVVGRVVSLEGHSRAGGALSMTVQVLENWKGKAEGLTLFIQGGDGWLCRPEVSAFPVGSQWLLALDGPGSKPGMGKGHALSSCGQYWLPIIGSKAQGRISAQDVKETLALAEIKSRLGSAAAANLSLEAEVKAGAVYKIEFGNGLIFGLLPVGGGWEIVVQQKGRDENLARLTPPLHFAPNPRFIEPGHFFGAQKARAEANAPGKAREFIFSPQVGQIIAGPNATRSPSTEDIENVHRYGRGQLSIADVQGNAQRIDRMRFKLDLRWQR